MGDNKTINFEAIVSDGSNQATTIVQITITDVSDLTPSCNPAAITANISEIAAANDLAVVLLCSDDGSLTYTLVGGNINWAFKFVGNEIRVNDTGSGSTCRYLFFLLRKS